MHGPDVDCGTAFLMMKWKLVIVDNNDNDDADAAVYQV